MYDSIYIVSPNPDTKSIIDRDGNICTGSEIADEVYNQIQHVADFVDIDKWWASDNLFGFPISDDKQITLTPELIKESLQGRYQYFKQLTDKLTQDDFCDISTVSVMRQCLYDPYTTYVCQITDTIEDMFIFPIETWLRQQYREIKDIETKSMSYRILEKLQYHY